MKPEKKTKPALWQSVVGAQPVRGPVNFRKVAVKHDAQATGVTGGRRFKFVRWRSKIGQLRTREYAVKAAAFVAAAVARGELCPVVGTIAALRDGFKYGHKISAKLNEIHHTRGRVGALLTDERFWLAVSKQGHRFIHEHPAEARQHGWLCEKGAWNVPDKSET